MRDFDSSLTLLSEVKDTRQLISILITIKSGVESPKRSCCNENIRKLRTGSNLRHMLSHLQSSHKPIVNATLSIVGNCCINLDCARDLKQHNILSALSQVLKRFTVEDDSINGRVYRILGNLCQHKDDWSVTIIESKPQLITHIVELLKLAASDEDNNVSEPTIVMGIRCIRELLNSITLMRLVKTFGVLKPLGLLLLKHSGDWNESKAFESILYNVIKAIYEYSKYKCPESIIELRNTEKGNSLLCLSDVLLLAPKRIVKIVMNLLQMSHLQSDLPIPEICDGFIKMLGDKSFIEGFQGEYEEYIRCICHLFDHPANRNNSRCGKSILLLINALKDFKEISNTTLTCSILIITTLNKCKYNESLIAEQIKHGIIPVLIEKLEWIVGSTKTLNAKHKLERKRNYSSMNNFHSRIELALEELKKPTSPSSSDDEGISSRYSFERSPSPCSSSDSDRSFRLNSHHLTQSDSDDYSPVCSDSEMNEFDLELDDKDDLLENDASNDVQGSAEAGTSDEASNTSPSLRGRLLHDIARLLKIYVNLQPPNLQLASQDLLIALVKSDFYYRGSVSSKFEIVEVLYGILQCHEYLLPIMLSDFIPMIYELTNSLHISSCNKCLEYSYVGGTILRWLCNLAESAVGRGNIAFNLSRGNDDTKKKLTLVIPYIIKHRSILSHFMISCGGLDTLLKLTQEEEVKTKSIKVLCVLAANKLAICNPKLAVGSLDIHSRKKRYINYSHRPTLITANKYKLSPDCREIVTFRLDDESLVKADRRFLSTKSDYFNTLLNGSFQESRLNEIRLHDISSDTLKCLLYLLHHSIKITEFLQMDLELTTLLDVVAQSDKFLLIELCMTLTECIEQHRISEETVPEIYKWSIESGTNLLRVESVAFALVENIPDEQRFHMFSALFNLGYSEELIKDIRTLLSRYLNVHSFSKGISSFLQ